MPAETKAATNKANTPRCIVPCHDAVGVRHRASGVGGPAVEPEEGVADVVERGQRQTTSAPASGP